MLTKHGFMSLISFSMLLHCQNRALENLITIFTAPLGSGSRGAYGGHIGVTRSIVEGLKKVNAPMNYNPSSLVNVGDVVVVLADVDALRQAIQWKKEGRIKKLLAGPNLMVRAIEYSQILASPEIDLVITPSDWVKTAYEEDLPAIKNRIQAWFAGVDVNYWNPTVAMHQKNKNMLIYRKTSSEEFTHKVEDIVTRHGWHVIRLTYGQYRQEQYKKLLDNCSCALFLSISESQGIALAEAWAMNVPTLVWNQKELIAHNRTYSTVSACPYLTPHTGLEWKALDELEKILASLDDRLASFAPRSWVLHNMTDAASADLLIKIIDNLFDHDSNKRVLLK